ncbi:MAG TPA: hypothetical protein PK098_13630, partial [Phycisphaerales bacterium]|nr:hypothetical protein [Phycisphaerales bacterium]
MRRYVSAVSVASVALLASPSFGAIIFSQWVGPGTGNWNAAANWDPATIPNNAADSFHVTINTAGSTVTLNQNATILSLQVGAMDELTIANIRLLTIHAAPKTKGAGVIQNENLIQLNSTGNTTQLRVSGGEVSLTGGGTIQLSNNSNNGLVRADAVASLVNVDNTIRGAGNIGAASSLPMTNHGLILAELSNALQLSPGFSLFTNTGTLGAQSGGTLQLNAGAYNNADGLIEAQTGSFVALDGNAIITGGELATSGSGVIQVTSNTPRLVNVLNTGLLRVPNNRNLQLQGTIENTGTIELSSAGNTTYIFPVGGPVSLTGGGTLKLSNHVQNWIYRGDALGSLINVDNIIRGGGKLGWSGAAMDVLNQHLIIADVPATLELSPGTATFTNDGTYRAQDGGTLQLNAGAYNNADGLIEAQTGSFVALDGNAIITGGELATSGSGVIQVTSNTPRLVNVLNTGLLRVPNNRNLQLQGTIENTGTIELSSAGNTTYIFPVGGPVSLTGGGTLKLSNHVQNWIYRGDALGSLINVDNTIRGGGNIGWSGAPMDILNQGTIIADVSAILHTSPASSTLTNESVLRAQDGGTLQLNAGAYDNTSGLIEAWDDSVVLLAASAIITGGELSTSGSGVIQVTSSTPRLVNVLNTGLLQVPNNRSLQLQGTIENTGTIELNSTINTTHIFPVGGPVTLTGGGTLKLSNHVQNWIYRGDALGSLINVDNTIRGGGNLGWNGAAMEIVNQGTIIADQAAALAIDATSASGFRNEGLLEVLGAGGVTGAGANFVNAGQVLIHPTRTLARTGHYRQTSGTTTTNGVLSVSAGNQLQ